MAGVSGFESVESIMAKVVDHVDALSQSTGKTQAVTRFLTGFRDLDEILRGFKPGELVVVAGRRFMGRTSLLLDIAAHTACELGFPVGVFVDMEADLFYLVRRVLSSMSGIDADRLRAGDVRDDEWPKMSGVLEKIQKSNFYISECILTEDPQAICDRARALHRQTEGLGLVVIDASHLVAHGRNLHRFKSLARELQCPVLVSSTVARNLEYCPRLRDVDEKTVDQADILVFIHRPEVYDPHCIGAGTAELVVGRNRCGSVGAARLNFNQSTMHFSDF